VWGCVFVCVCVGVCSRGVCVCVGVCLDLCLFVFVSACVCESVCVRNRENERMCMCERVCVRACIYVRVCMCVHARVLIYVFVFTYICVFVLCIYVCACTQQCEQPYLILSGRSCTIRQSHKHTRRVCEHV